MTQAQSISLSRFPSQAGARSMAVLLQPLHWLMSAPALLLIATLTAMLFRPPDVKFYCFDRVAFGVLLFVVSLRVLLLRQPLHLRGPVVLPMFALTLIAVGSAFNQAYDAETWSVVAAKWIVPLCLYVIAGLIFDSASSLRTLEIFCLLVLAYLTVTAVLFLSGEKSLIFPPFILDESIGIHADRARGPFLQAVANGVSLNLLGLVALDSYRRHKLRGLAALLLLIGLPLAILATKTRAVWASFAVSVVAMLAISPSRRVRRACLCLVLAGAFGVFCAFTFEDVGHTLNERLAERSPVEFRMAMYRAGWDMFCARPLLGWGSGQVQADLEKRISDFHQSEFFFHNTFLEIAVEFGTVGLLLYAWMVFGLLRLGRKLPSQPVGSGFLDSGFRAMWPVILGVYLLNACFVVMNYQFVNGVLFTFAGILAAQNRAAVSRPSGLQS
jgi:putative inorganic carbon (HCO3(-)) transporter